MESKEIYVVVATKTTRHDCAGSKVRLFSTLDKAKSYMECDFEKNKNSYPELTEFELMNAYAYISDNETTIEWSIDVEVVDRMNV